MRRAVSVVMITLLVVSTIFFLWLLWGMANPSHGPGTVKLTTSTWTINLNIGRNDWSRLVQAADRFAIQHGLIDEQMRSLVPTSELRRSSVNYESKDAELKIERKTTEADTATVEIRVRIREFDGSGAGQRLKSAFENDVIRAGRFGE